MNKMIGLFIVAGALAFTACSDSGSSSGKGVVSCDMKVISLDNEEDHNCMEYDKKYSSEVKAMCNAMSTADPKGSYKFGSGCENADLSCTVEEAGMSVTTYYYGEAYANMSCSDFEMDFE